jgi:hypothetical protein
MEHIILHERDRALTLPTSPLHEDIERSLFQNPSTSTPALAIFKIQGQTDSHLHPNQPKPLL